VVLWHARAAEQARLAFVSLFGIYFHDFEIDVAVSLMQTAFFKAVESCRS
jgi:hypothetical protein